MSRAEVIAAIKENNIVVQKKLLTDHFAAELNDALVHNIVTSLAHSADFKLKAQLENIMRLHAAIPMDLQKILCDFCMSERFSSDYVFLIGYLEKSSQAIIITAFIEQSNHADWYAKSAAITALSDIFTYLDVEQKKLVLDKLIEKLNDPNSGAARSAAIIALGTVFADLDVEQKTLILDKLIAKLNHPEQMVEQAAKEALENIVLNNVLSPMQKQLLLSHPKLTDAAKIKITQAVLNFISPCINISTT